MNKMNNVSILILVFNEDVNLKEWYNIIDKFDNIDVTFFSCSSHNFNNIEYEHKFIFVQKDLISDIEKYIRQRSNNHLIISPTWNSFDESDISDLNFDNDLIFFNSKLDTLNNHNKFKLNLLRYLFEQLQVLFNSKDNNLKNEVYESIRSEFIKLDLSKNILDEFTLDEYSFYIRILNNESFNDFKNYVENVSLPWEYINKEKLSNVISNFTDIGITLKKRNPRIIVSLTSYPDRINEVKYVIFSLLNQNLKPDEIILWLAKEQFPNNEEDIPDSLLKLKENGLTIKWCKDIRPYKKLIPALNEYPNDYIVTVDDDIYYPKDWLEKIWKTSKKYPNTIISARARSIKFKDGKLEDYNNWDVFFDFKEPSYLSLPTGAGGTLYCPHALSNIVFNEQLFNELCPTADDMWFWAMAVLNRTKITCIDKPFAVLNYVNVAQEAGILDNLTLWQHNKEGYNDIQFKNILDNFPEILKIITDE